MNTMWIPNEYLIKCHESWLAILVPPSVSGYVAAKVTLVDSVTFAESRSPTRSGTMWHITSKGERENGHLIFQSHGLEVHFCFGFSVFFGSWGHFWEFCCSVCPPRKANEDFEDVSLWHFHFAAPQRPFQPDAKGLEKPWFLKDYALCFGKLRPKQRVQKKHW